MSKIKAIFPLIGNIVKGLSTVSILGLNLFIAYIMFAPDSYPKPVYINHRTMVLLAPIDSTQVVGEAATPEPTVDPLVEYEPGEGELVDTGTKIVNLADAGGRRYLKTTITIEVAPPAGLQATEETAHAGGEATEDPILTAFADGMNANMPVINDTLTTLLSSKTFEEIYTIDGKEALRLEIQANLNARLPELYVIAVYFTEFIVQ